MFTQGSYGDEFYIVRSGRFYKEVVMDVEDCNCYPKTPNSWEVSRMKKKYVY